MIDRIKNSLWRMVFSQRNDIRVGLLFLAVLSSAVAADDDACQGIYSENSFTYLKDLIYSDRLRDIQDLLNQAQCGPIAVDGIAGKDTRAALVKFCDAEKDNLNLSADQSVAQQVMHHINVHAQDIEDAFSQHSNDSVCGGDLRKQMPNNPAVYFQLDDAIDLLQTDEEKAKIKPMVDVPFASEALFESALTFYLPDLAKPDSRYLADTLIQHSEVNAGDTFHAVTVQASENCACSRDFSKLIYGFYPYWLASDKEAQVIDFSLYDRIGFYALPMDEQGDIAMLAQWNDETIGRFITTAHKYRVDVDLTVAAKSWALWDANAIENAVETITRAVTKRFKAVPDDVFQQVVGQKQLQIDGVTLIFNGYDPAGDNADNIVALVRKLAVRLQAEERDYAINIVLGADVSSVVLDTESANAEQEDVTFRELDNILLPQGDDAPLINYLLVFLQEDTARSKMQLRQIVEQHYPEKEQRTILRKIIPVLSPDGHALDAAGPYEKITANLIYLEDNFGGVGFWPLLINGQEGAEEITTQLNQIYKEPAPAAGLSGFFQQYAPAQCELVCPNRWLFRLAIDILAAGLITYLIAAIWIFRLRGGSYLAGFILVACFTLLLSVVLLGCDPFWNERARIVVLMVDVAIVLGVLGRWIIKRSIPKPLP